MYGIWIKGRMYKFDTLEAARKAASDIFDRTKIVVGIMSLEASPYCFV